MELLYRSEKRYDEFLIDYVGRIADNNGFASRKAFVAKLSILFSEQYCEPYYSFKYYTKNRLTLEFLLKRSIGLDEHHRFYLRKRGIWRKKNKICASCWVNEPYIRFYWWLNGYDKCHIHNELLLTVIKNEENFDGEEEYLITLVPALVKKYYNRTNCQFLVMRELDYARCDMSLIKSLSLHFSCIPDVLLVVDEIFLLLINGSFVGKPADVRIRVIVNMLAKHIETETFWYRIICLMVMDYKRGVKSNFPFHHHSSRNYVHFSRYYLSTDKVLIEFLQEIQSLKSLSEMDCISVERFLEQSAIFPNEFIFKLKYSLFALRECCFQLRYESYNRKLEQFYFDLDVHDINREV